jgi:uracil-DNA glycosylase
VRAAVLVEELAAACIGRTYNFYRDGEGAPLRRARLGSYLASREDASLVLVGEAAGYRGARVSGIPFTSERQLSGGDPCEPSATIVHAVLADLGIEDDTMLWNVVPTHPHLPGLPRTNRRPTRDEIDAARPYLTAIAGGRRAVAVGRLAEATVGGPYVRHPSHGGAPAFREGLRKIIDRL